MTLSLVQTQAINALARALADFLPGTPHPRADASISFPGAVAAAHLHTPWPGASKHASLVTLLSAVVEREPQKVTRLLQEIVKRALVYRGNKQPLTRDEVDDVNRHLVALGIRIPELVDRAFLASLPARPPTQTAAPPAVAVPVTPAGPRTPSRAVLATLLLEVQGLESMDANQRGVVFERFLNTLFHAFDLAPRDAFRLRGEQIDGSFVLDGVTYLVEAKWQATRTGNRDLAAFNDQVGAKAAWARGLFVSYAGFTGDGLDAYRTGRSSRILLMEGMDLFFVLSAAVGLRELLAAKDRRAVEEGRAFVPVTELFPNARP